MTLSAKGFLRALGVLAILFLHFLQATIGTAWIEGDFWHGWNTNTLAAATIKEFVLSAVIAFVLGYLISWFFKSTLSQWTWIGGVIALLFAAAQWPQFEGSRLIGIHGSFREQFETLCAADRISCLNFSTNLAVTIRAVLYSAGAILYWHGTKGGPAAADKAMKSFGERIVGIFDRSGQRGVE